MWNTPSRQRLIEIPALYATDNTELRDKLIYLHFFIGNCDWYVAEFNGKDTFWGFVVLNGDLLNAEWGYFTLSELQSVQIHGVEIDCELEDIWQIKRASKIDKICQAQRWNLPIKMMRQAEPAIA